MHVFQFDINVTYLLNVTKPVVLGNCLL